MEYPPASTQTHSKLPETTPQNSGHEIAGKASSQHGPCTKIKHVHAPEMKKTNMGYTKIYDGSATYCAKIAAAGVHAAACTFCATNGLLLPFKGGEVDVVLEDGLPFLKIRHDVVLVEGTHPLVELDPAVVSWAVVADVSSSRAGGRTRGPTNVATERIAVSLCFSCRVNPRPTYSRETGPDRPSHSHPRYQQFATHGTVVVVFWRISGMTVGIPEWLPCSSTTRAATVCKSVDL